MVTNLSPFKGAGSHCELILNTIFLDYSYTKIANYFAPNVIQPKHSTFKAYFYLYITPKKMEWFPYYIDWKILGYVFNV